ncbi:MAG TPA: hypothetical protein VE597_08270 [Geminicoccaceae bacterium]|jgi:predicted CopG family antitoxin|nr:hypothetical protein [Geminicoccaceae bacterium]
MLLLKLQDALIYVFNTCKEPAVRKKLTITVDEEVYRGLHKVVGRRHISRFLTELARPHVVEDDLEAGYRAMAADEEHEREALEWIEGVVADVADEPG